MKSKRTKACDITKKVKDKVWKRDNERCIICGNHEAMPNSHFIRRSQNGLGCEENIVTMCRRCHVMYDQGCDRTAMEAYIERYLKNHYPGWSREKLIYKKWSE